VFVVYTAGWNKLESVVMENEQALTACDQVNKYFFVFTKHVLKTQCVDFAVLNIMIMQLFSNYTSVVKI